MSLKIKNSEFTQLYEKYREEIYRYCYIKLKPNSQTAEDCTQNAFLALYEKLKNGVSIDNPRAFLYKAASNYVLKAYRDNEKHHFNSVPLDDYENKLCDNQYEIDSNIDYALLNKRLLSLLNKDEQELFRLKFIDDLTISQIKDALNISNDAAAKRLQRLRAKLINSVNQTQNGKENK